MSDDLDLIQGTWRISALEVDGQALPAAMVEPGRLVINGNRFSSKGMGAVYEGILELDATQTPQCLNMRFDGGPEKGNTNPGIYDLSDDTWKICLATRGNVRPSCFDSRSGEGFALETLVRGDVPVEAKKAKSSGKAVAEAPSTAPATELEGEWSMLSGIFNGVPMEESNLKWVKRVTQGDRSTVTAGPQVMLNVEFSIDPAKTPKTIEYLNLAGSNKGNTQQGIYELAGDVLKICVSAPGAPSPEDYTAVRGDGRTLTVWKRAN